MASFATFLPSLLLLFHFTMNSLALVNTSCNVHERSALFQFKESFIIDCSVSYYPLAHSKFESWKLDENGDCCLWDGVDCDENTGQVIGLDLHNSCLYGSIDSHSSLFQLVHLRTLKLGYNHFNYSKIPAEIGQFLNLTSLDLSSSSFSGKIPSNISHLSKLSALDLSRNDDLILKTTDFESLVQNSTNLQYLDLSWVDLSSEVPKMMGNLSSLKLLHLSNCDLYGDFPEEILRLSSLQVLDLSFNWVLQGSLPEFNITSSLQELTLQITGFSGQIPYSIGSLISLVKLDISGCSFTGTLADSLGNLKELLLFDITGNRFQVQKFSSLSWIGNLTKLTNLHLSWISLKGEFLSYFANLTNLRQFSLISCEIKSEIPSWIGEMTQLVALALSFNELHGPIPHSISKLTRLVQLRLDSNNLEGAIPYSIFQLQNLRFLNLARNNLSGVVEMNKLSKLKNLTTLRLSGNRVSLLASNNSNASLQKFHVLGLASCNLRHFPNLLHDQDRLVWLDLSDNKIHGQIPSWMQNMSKDSLRFLNISYNFLTGFEVIPTALPWSQVTILDLSFNLLTGNLPMPAPSIKMYKASSNNITGEISPRICNLKVLSILDLSHNKLSGMLPQCFANFSSSLQLLNLRNNSFHGRIPDTHTDECNLKMLVLDNNRLNGQLPRSLVNCSRLELLSLGNNQIHDSFPDWLAAIQELKILILRSNQFYGAISSRDMSNHEFKMLHILDLSENKISGQIPKQYFSNWDGMKITGINGLTYLKTDINFITPEFSITVGLWYSISITNKGSGLAYAKVLNSFVAIDLSSNEIEGEIPEIGNLKGLRLLNFSNNNFKGVIPSSLGNLQDLESLDISQNKLSGNIPQKLAQLHFLSVFNVSFNNLTGDIPRGGQFDTFIENSYIGNSGLCGNVFSRKCPSSDPSYSEVQDSAGSSFDFGWKQVAVGSGCGIIFGVVLGHIVTERNSEWFLKTFRVR